MGAPGPRREPLAPSGASPGRVIVLSLLAFGLACAFSRQIPAEVRVVSDLRSLATLAALFGLGLGGILQERRSLAGLLPLGLGLVFVFVFVNRGVPADAIPEGVLVLLEGGPPAVPLLPPPLPAAGAAILFACVAPAFVALGQGLARAMDRDCRLLALSWVLAGGLAATTLHALAALTDLPPWAAVSGLAGLAVVVLPGGRWQRGALLATGLAFLLFGRSSLPGQWSPYALVQHVEVPSGGAVLVNAAFHDLVLDIPEGTDDSRRARAVDLERWRRPHRLFREINGRGPESVLVLGAGAGNDVAAALDQGVLRVVAVEIDPVILDVSGRLQSAPPFSDPRVEVVVGDPRHFLRTSRETFDLVVFGTLDRRAAPSDEALLPWRSFSYTREAFEDARERLVEGGLLAVHGPPGQGTPPPGVHRALRSAFDDRTRVTAAGARPPLGATLVASGRLDAREADPETALGRVGARLPTDDWPYALSAQAGIGPAQLRLLGVGAVLVLASLLTLHRVRPVAGLHLDYLLLGAGAALMGTMASSRLSLAFGQTWLVGTVALSCALLILLLANALVLRRRAAPPAMAWAGVLVTVLLNYLPPTPFLLALGPPGRLVAVGFLLGAPTLCLGLCFGRLYAGEPVSGHAIGVALVGAMAGGLLEHVSVVTGMRAVWLLTLGPLALAGVAARLIHRRPATP